MNGVAYLDMLGEIVMPICGGGERHNEGSFLQEGKPRYPHLAILSRLVRCYVSTEEDREIRRFL